LSQGERLGRMTKALAILGIVGAVLAALTAFALSGPLVPLLVLLFLVVAAIFLFVRRSALTTVLGIVLILLGLSALLFFNPVTGNNDQVYLPDLPPYFDSAWLTTLTVLGCAAILLAARDDVDPAWTGYLGLAAALLAILLVPFVPLQQTGNFANPLGIGVAVLVLILLIPLIVLLRGPPAPAAPTVERGGTVATRAPGTLRK
jgi:hypothetical protein